MWSRGMWLIFPYQREKKKHHVIWPFMHSCIKSIATRENRLCVSATQQRLTALIAKVIKPINVVLCAACHWVDGTLSFCWAFHEPYESEKKKCTYCQLICSLIVHPELGMKWFDLHIYHWASTPDACQHQWSTWQRRPLCTCYSNTNFFFLIRRKLTTTRVSRLITVDFCASARARRVAEGVVGGVHWTVSPAADK